MLSMLQAAAIGLEPDGRNAHLIPYKNQCTLQLDYKGIVQLVRRSGDVADIHADMVFENDQFSYCFGTGSHLKHTYALGKPRGKPIAVYSYCRLKDGTDSFDVMSIEEVDAIRDNRSQGYRSAKQYGKSHPWDTDYPEMAKKTVFKRHSKWLPVSAELAEQLAKEDEVDDPERVTLDVGQAAAEAAEAAASRPKLPLKKKGVAAMDGSAAKPVEPAAPPQTVAKEEPAASEAATPPVVESTPTSEAKTPTTSGLPPATHELTAFRDVTAKKTDGNTCTLVACDLCDVNNKKLTAYWEGTRDVLPELGWVAVAIEHRPHSTKPGVTVPYILKIEAAATPEI